jgi:hypothetical protein
VNKTFDPLVVVAFDVVEEFKAPNGIPAYRCLSRRFHVKEAAEIFAKLRPQMIPSCLTDDELLRLYDELFHSDPAIAELAGRFRARLKDSQEREGAGSGLLVTGWTEARP